MQEKVFRGKLKKIYKNSVKKALPGRECKTAS